MIKNLINVKALNLERISVVSWILFCVLLGSVGWGLHDPKLYQPWAVWVTGTFLFETVMLFLLMILSSFITSFFFPNYINILKETAGKGFVNYKNSKASENFCTVLLVLFIILMNSFMIYNLFMK